jgi:hypothetical protein
MAGQGFSQAEVIDRMRSVFEVARNSIRGTHSRFMPARLA